MSDSDKKSIVTSITYVVDKTYKIARFIMSNLLLICLCLISLLSSILCFHHTSIIMTKQMNNLNNYNNIHNFKYNTKASKTTTTSIQMNIFNDAFRFFTNMNKQASAKHILIKGPQTQAIEKLKILKDELNASKDINLAFSELASKVSECPSASRGIELILLLKNIYLFYTTSLSFNNLLYIIN